jgi:hypothetical protein
VAKMQAEMVRLEEELGTLREEMPGVFGVLAL